MERSLLVAIGGNALIRNGQRGTITEQAENARDTARPIAALVAEGWRVVVTHGNGPQVGFILLRSELAGPKIEAAIMFLKRGGGEALITSSYRLAEAVAGRTGTRIVADAR